MRDTYINPLQLNSEKLRFMSVRGRIGRVRLLAWSLLLVAAGVGSVLLFALMSSLAKDLAGAIVPILLAAKILSLVFVARRMNDLGLNGWYSLLTLIPYYIGNLIFLALLLLPGNRASNRYGPPPPPNSKAVIVLAWLWVPLLALGLFLAASHG
ncbi:DUF805 domain-containing protein [Pseudomonas sp. MAFF212428]|uniref:DUF805 domain-containing protein n=1 Tax=Pseudomonas brassicae TaxID=2708063 RepID=A0A6B3NRE7_9PSED|nr:DUF805 domain-containing protein [Pseudomonas brassicae]NER60639.1 DUF805 domain-containing protein [Pseudomonas brassicae]NER62830.1 DUF805 domain-containing protein [Pseudomonas brassicae]